MKYEESMKTGHLSLFHNEQRCWGLGGRSPEALGPQLMVPVFEEYVVFGTWAQLVDVGH